MSGWVRWETKSLLFFWMNSKKSQIKTQKAFYLAREYTDALFGLIRPDSFYERPIPERHRFIFYLGHLEAFDWNIVCREAFDMGSSHSDYDQLFAFGIDPPPGQLPLDLPSEWPSVQEIKQYNKGVRSTIDQRMGEIPELNLNVALEHRLMHFETLTYIFHRLSDNRKTLSLQPRFMQGEVPFNSMVEIPPGKATLGKSREDGFGWDNEFGVYELQVPSFRVSKYKISNDQYLKFVQDGGPPPSFWVDRGGKWFYRGVFGEVPLPLSWPVYVDHQGASAYAKWKGFSLPTEAQYHRSAFGDSNGRDRPFPWGDIPPLEVGLGHINFQHWDPIPVTMNPQWDSAFGVSQLLGNGWEWTSTVFSPFEGFETFDFPQFTGAQQH